MAPVYAVGLSKSDTWYMQTAYSLETPHMVTGQRPAMSSAPSCASANNRSEPIACQIQLALPEGWKAENPDVSANVAAGEARSIELPFTVAFTETLGFKDVKVLVLGGQAAQANGREGPGAVSADGPDQPDRRPAGHDASDRPGRQPFGQGDQRRLADAPAGFMERPHAGDPDRGPQSRRRSGRSSASSSGAPTGSRRRLPIDLDFGRTRGFPIR